MNMKSKKGTKDKANKNYIWLQKTIDKRNLRCYNKVESNSKWKENEIWNLHGILQEGNISY